KRSCQGSDAGETPALRFFLTTAEAAEIVPGSALFQRAHGFPINRARKMRALPGERTKILARSQRIFGLVVQIRIYLCLSLVQAKTSGCATNHGYGALPALCAWNRQPRGWLF